jgi:uncharacterized damage-inducible protein DinB
MKEYFKVLARYNRWANELLYDSCVQLTREEYLEDRQAFFRSIHGTLNHLLVTDRLWLGRFENRDSGITALYQILYADFNSLLQARKKEDETIIQFIDQIDPKKIEENFTFKNL